MRNTSIRRALPKNRMAMLSGVTVLSVLASAGGALADWRTEMGVFRIGVAAVDGEPYKPGQFEVFRQAVSKALSMPVEIFQARDAAALIDAQASSRIEYSIMTALGYATADTLCSCVEPIAAPTTGSGATAVRSILVADAKRVPDMQALASARVAIGPVSALTSGLIPRADFLWQGKPLAESDLTLVEMPSQEAALTAFASGEVDALFAWDYTLPGTAREFTSPIETWIENHKKKATLTLWLSEPVPFGPHVVRRNLPQEAIVALRDFLVRLDQAEPLAYDAVSGDLAGGFVAVTKSDYGHALDLVKKAVGPDKDR